MTKEEKRELVYATRIELINELEAFANAVRIQYHGDAREVLSALWERMDQIKKAS